MDVAICIGAAWILGGFAPTAARLRELVPPGGHVAIGDLYRRDPLQDHRDSPSLSLAQLVEAIEAASLQPITILESSADDWHTYTSLMWLSIEDWLIENATHPEADRFRNQSRASDLDEHRHGWAIVAGRRTGTASDAAVL